MLSNPGERRKGCLKVSVGSSETTGNELDVGQLKDRLGAHSVERVIGGKRLVLSTGRMAKQADGAVVAACGGSIVLVSAQSAAPLRDLGFFPLTVE